MVALDSRSLLRRAYSSACRAPQEILHIDALRAFVTTAGREELFGSRQRTKAGSPPSRGNLPLKRRPSRRTLPLLRGSPHCEVSTSCLRASGSRRPLCGVVANVRGLNLAQVPPNVDFRARIRPVQELERKPALAPLRDPPRATRRRSPASESRPKASSSRARFPLPSYPAHGASPAHMCGVRKLWR